MRLRAAPPANRTRRGIIALDPGPHSAVAIYHPYPAIAHMPFHTYTRDYTEYLGGDAHVDLYSTLFRERQDMYESLVTKGDLGDDGVVIDLVCEKFEFRKDDAKNRERINFDAAEYVGIAKFVGESVYDNLVMQSPSEAVGDTCFWSDAKVKQLGLWKPNSRHEMDALRHLLKYLTFGLHQKWLYDHLK